MLSSDEEDNSTVQSELSPSKDGEIDDNVENGVVEPPRRKLSYKNSTFSVLLYLIS